MFVPAPKPHERSEARRLRQAYGLPHKQIAARLNVPPASVHAWTRDIEITYEQAARNMRRSRTAFSRTWRELHRKRRQTYQEEGRERARLAEPLHLAGCMLFWAEGSKERNAVKLCNSDVNMLRFFKRFVVECFDVEPREFSMSIHVYLGNGMSIQDIEGYWLTELELPASCARKHQVNPLPTSSSGKKRNKLPHGVCTLALYSTRLAQHIYGAIQEYGGFDEPRWLDGSRQKPRRRKRR
jgi:hypothetical protein